MNREQDKHDVPLIELVGKVEIRSQDHKARAAKIAALGKKLFLETPHNFIKFRDFPDFQNNPNKPQTNPGGKT